jgi:hypothetical protein
VNINYNNLFIIETLIATSQNGSIANKKRCTMATYCN